MKINAQNDNIEITDIIISGEIQTNTINEGTTSSGVTIDGVLLKDAGVTLATTGGTATPLNYYEEYTSSGNTFGGIWGSDLSVEFKIIRIGKLILISIPDLIATATAAATITSSQMVPTRFLNGTSNYWVVHAKNNGVEQASLLQLNSLGTLTIYGTQNRGNFTGSGSSGLLRTQVVLHKDT